MAVYSRIKRLLLSAGALSVLASASAHAQGTGSPAVPSAEVGLNEDIIVTATKREQSVQDIPLAVTAVGGKTIDQLGFTQTNDVLRMVPSVKISEFSAAVLVVNIRGVSQNDFADHLEAPVAVYSDQAYISSTGAISGQLFDMERVEVLRGPQGTLFGRNATGGLIHYISRKPTGTPDGYLQVSAMTFGSFHAEGAIGGPLADGVNARISASTTQQEGYFKNLIGPDVNSMHATSVRAQVSVRLSDTADLLLKGHYANNDDTSGAAYSTRAARPGADGLGVFVARDENFWGTCNGCDLLGYRNESPRRASLDFSGKFKRDVYGGTATLNVDVGPLTVTSVTDYLGVKKFFSEDVDGTPNPLANYWIRQKVDQLSQELRAAGTAGDLDYILGAYYLNIESNIPTAVIDVPAFGLRYDSNWRTESESLAAFAQLDYRFSPEWTLTAGARYTHDTREQNYAIRDNAGYSFAFNPATDPRADQTYENVSAKVSIQYEPTSDSLFYASITRGHKAGNFAAPVTAPVVAANIPHDQEVLTSYEVGFKLNWGTTRLNGAAFYYDYKDYQAYTLLNLLQSIGNLDAKVKGVELEFATKPLEGLDIMLSGSFLDTKVKDVILPSGRAVDRELPLAADFSMNGVVRYEWPAFNGSLAVQSDFSYTDSFNFVVLGASITREKAYFVGNARVSYTTDDDRWEVSAFVKNFSNTLYRNYANDLSSLGFAQSTYAPPRWVGASAAYRW